jgi:hypothetical protein
MRIDGAATVLAMLTWNVSALHATQVQAVPLKAGDVYSVESTETLRGHIDFRPPEGKGFERLKYNGRRKTRYLERVLAAKAANDDIPERVLRVIEELDSKRKMGDSDQVGFPLRDESKQVVIHRGEAFSKPFSLKGPLKQEEIHTLSHLVFVPALNGLLPKGPLAVGAKWTANRRAVAQLAGLVPLETGDLSCTVKRLDFPFRGSDLVQIGFSGVLVGESEEGRVSDDVVGSFYVVRETGKIHSLTVEGIRTLYDAKDKTKEVGRLEMKYELSVRMKEPTPPELADAIAAEAAEDPTPEQTAVLYEFPPCAVKLVHPRTWMLANAGGTRLEFLYGKELHQIEMNFHADDDVPTTAKYHADVSESLKKDKFENVAWTQPPIEQAKGDKKNGDYRRIGTFEATAKKNGDWRMRYWIWQVGVRGVTMGVYTHSAAARNGDLTPDGYAILKKLTFTGDKNPFYVKKPADKAGGGGTKK